jgi:hypothetical protein
VDEHILSALIRLNESVAFFGVEPFHCAGSHKKSFRSRQQALIRCAGPPIMRTAEPQEKARFKRPFRQVIGSSVPQPVADDRLWRDIRLVSAAPASSTEARDAAQHAQAPDDRLGP